MFAKLRGKKEETPAAEPSEEQQAKDEEDAVKEEKSLQLILEKARKLFFEKRIVGSIDVARTFGMFTTGLSCEIDGSEEADVTPDEQPAAAEDKEKATRFEKVIITSLVKAVNSLEGRAKAYRSRAYKKDLSLSTSIYVSDPILGISSLSVSCTATVSSLLAMSEGGK